MFHFLWVLIPPVASPPCHFIDMRMSGRPFKRPLNQRLPHIFPLKENCRETAISDFGFHQTFKEMRVWLNRLWHWISFLGYLRSKRLPRPYESPKGLGSFSFVMLYGLGLTIYCFLGPFIYFQGHSFLFVAINFHRALIKPQSCPNSALIMH